MRPPNPREVREGLGATFVFRPPERWTSATGLVKDRLGRTIETPTPTLDSVSTTVATNAANTADVFELTSVVGVSRGKVYEVTDEQWGTAQAEVSRVDTSTKLVTLVEPLPTVPADGSAFLGVEVSLAVAAISDRALGYRAIVRGGTAGQEQVERFDVVYQPWVDPLQARDVRRYVDQLYPGNPVLRDEERLKDVAQKACDHVRLRLRSSNRYESRFFATSDLVEPCEHAMMLVLAKQSLIPGDTDPIEFKRALEFDLRDRISDILQSSIPYDADADDQLSDAEAAGIWSGSLSR